MSLSSFIPMASPVLGKKELDYAVDAIKSGWISSQGKYVSQFETLFSNYCNTKYGIAVANGTTSLHLALVSLGIGPKTEVITTPLTHIAVVNAITLTGAKSVFVDSDINTWNLDPKHIEEKITKKTKAILVVHLYGHPNDMDPIYSTAKKYDLYVIEDAAEAHGAEYNNKKVGSLGDLACFSFYANKIITTGEGGMIITDIKKLADKARKLRDQAYEKTRRFWHRELGFNYRFTNIQAAIGVAQMGKINKFIDIRRRNAQLYNSLLAEVPGISLPPEAPWAKNVYWMYSILVDKKKFGITRDELINRLKVYGIDSRRFFFPIHMQPLYKNKFKGERYLVAEYLSRTGLNLPSGNELTERQIERIVQAIKRIYKQVHT